jgi:hypothetical protein
MKERQQNADMPCRVLRFSKLVRVGLTSSVTLHTHHGMALNLQYSPVQYQQARFYEPCCNGLRFFEYIAIFARIRRLLRPDLVCRHDGSRVREQHQHHEPVIGLESCETAQCFMSKYAGSK